MLMETLNNNQFSVSTKGRRNKVLYWQAFTGKFTAPIYQAFFTIFTRFC
jgi:hypothetical protein